MSVIQSRLSEILASHEDEILREWISRQAAASPRALGTADENQLKRTCREFLSLFRSGAAAEKLDDIGKPEWSAVREFLSDLSAARAKAGFTPAQTAMFIFSLKEPLFEQLRRAIENPQTLVDEIWRTTGILDRLGLYTTEAHQRTREELIARQQQELLELSTPVVRLWDNVLALPLIGTLDSARTQVVMQNLLQAIVETRSDIAIIDITGVPTVDTLVAQHLLKTVAAARLMGADCIISGIRPQIAQTIIHLGVNLEDVTTKATLADAFAVALRRTGHSVTDSKAAAR